METGNPYTASVISNGRIDNHGGLPGSFAYDIRWYKSEVIRRRERIHMRWMLVAIGFILVIILCAIAAVIVASIHMAEDGSSTGIPEDSLCNSKKCRTPEETSRPTDGSQTPKYPLSISDFRRYLVPNKMREFFYFSKPVAHQHLRRLVVTWIDMGDGTYKNTFIAREPTYDICVTETITPLGTPITLTPVGDGKASFRFLNFDGSPDIVIGHIFSACPDKYFFNWYCPEKNVNSQGYCTKDSLMDLVFIDLVPDHLPWHTITTDLYNNTGLYMDDQRWTLTFRGDTCDNTT